MSLDKYIFFEKYRPKTIREVSLEPAYKAAFEKYIGDANIPHILMSGPAGCGKSTIAFILMAEIPCVTLTLNASGQDRGIDTVKGKIAQFAASQPPKGKIKIILLDECFAKGSLVKTPGGETPIEDISVGDLICNINGEDTVTKKHCNKVPLNRVVKITYGGIDTFCSEDHKFLTETGWVIAKNLCNSTLLCYSSKYATNNYLLQGNSDGNTGSKMQLLLHSVSDKLCKWGFQCKDLPLMQSTYIKKMRMVWDRVLTKGQVWTFLFGKMCGDLENVTPSLSRSRIQRRSESENFRKTSNLESNQGRDCSAESIFYANERHGNQSTFQRSYCKRGCYKALKRYFVGWGTRWERLLDRTTETFSSSLGVGTRTFCTNSTSFAFRRENGMVPSTQIPNALQCRFGGTDIKNSSRGRWENALDEKSYIERLKEDNSVRRVRVESVEVYKRGSNDKSFSSIIGGTECTQGFVEFYDLSVHKNPSYVVNGLTVHNCDMITPAAQAALRNLMETHSDSCRFILTCNYPDKIIPAIHSRCTQFAFGLFPKKKVQRLCNDILAKEGIDTAPKDELEELVDKYYPDIRSVINNLQMAVVSGSFNLKSLGQNTCDPATMLQLMMSGEVLTLRSYIAGVTDFTFLYKFLFNHFMQGNYKNEDKSSILTHIADIVARDSVVPDREINFISCCLPIMECLGIKANFKK